MRRVYIFSAGINYTQISELESGDTMLKKAVQNKLSILCAILESTADGIIVIDLMGRILEYNQKFLELWQISPAVVLHHEEVYELLFLSDQLENPKTLIEEIFVINHENNYEGYQEIVLRDGRIFERYVKPLLMDGAIHGRVISFRDISERKKLTEQLTHQATHDSLTGLPNRKLLLDHLRLAVGFARRTELLFALLFVDLDHFKKINDTYGHEIGDIFLQKIAERLESCMRETDTVVRLGGDEFVIVLMPIQKKEDVIVVVNKIMSACAKPVKCGPYKIRSTASVGISTYPECGERAEILIKKADKAMYQVKLSGRNNFAFFD